MDPIKILKRAWQILWSYRALWVFGLILAMAGVGSQQSSSRGNSSSTNSSSSHQEFQAEDIHQFFKSVPHELQKLFDQGLAKVGIPKADVSTLIWIAMIFVLLCTLLSIGITIARYVAETSIIRMVDEYENTGKQVTIREGFRMGWSRTAWRLFVINLIVSLPFILAMILLFAAGAMAFYTLSQSGQETAIFGVIATVIALFLILFVVAIISIFLFFLRNFFWRASVLEDLGVRDSLRRGFQMVRENWKNVGIMWLVMIGLGIVWSFVSIIAFVVALPVILVTAVIGALVAVIPALIAGGLTSIVLHGSVAWAIGAIFALPLFFTVAFSPWLLIGSWQTVYASTVWTLVYRELKALPALTSGNALPEVAN